MVGLSTLSRLQLFEYRSDEAGKDSDEDDQYWGDSYRDKCKDKDRSESRVDPLLCTSGVVSHVLGDLHTPLSQLTSMAGRTPPLSRRRQQDGGEASGGRGRGNDCTATVEAGPESRLLTDTYILTRSLRAKAADWALRLERLEWS